MELLNPERRQKMDEELAAQAEERAVAEFQKYLAFALNDKRLLPHEEETLLQFGRDNALSEERIRGLIDAELAASGAVRVLAARRRKRLRPRIKSPPANSTLRKISCACSGSAGSTAMT